MVICKWGCALWMRAGQQEFIHQQRQCSKRILQCILKCPCRLREEEWLSPWLGAEEALARARADPDEAPLEDPTLERDLTSAQESSVRTFQQHHEEVFKMNE